jgi:hypothetical protein
VGLALLEGVARDLDLLGVAYLAVGHVDLEGRVGYVLAHPLDRDLVGPGLPGRERHADVAARHLLQEAGLLEAARRRYRRVQRADVRVADLPRQLDLGGRADRDLVALAAFACVFQHTWGRFSWSESWPTRLIDAIFMKIRCYQTQCIGYYFESTELFSYHIQALSISGHGLSRSFPLYIFPHHLPHILNTFLYSCFGFNICRYCPPPAMLQRELGNIIEKGAAVFDDSLL